MKASVINLSALAVNIKNKEKVSHAFHYLLVGSASKMAKDGTSDAIRTSISSSMNKIKTT
jgi:hypothetical protein